MFKIADHINNIDIKGNSYCDGRKAFLNNKSITACPTYGTTWDHGNWLAGWLDELADGVRSVQTSEEPSGA